jgi:hypothetical protein
MALSVYLTREEVPNNIKIIDSNDAYFNGYTVIGNSDFENNVLSTIDKAKRTSELTFIGRTEKLGNLNKSCLSTGTKTLLNIYNNPDVCFNVDECGDNALEFLCDLNRGNILWEFPYINFERDKEDCCIICRGIHFSNMIDFMDYDWGN